MDGTARWPGWSPSSPGSPAGSPPTRSAGSWPTWPATGCSTSCRSTRSARWQGSGAGPGRCGSGGGLLAFARGRRMVLANIDRVGPASLYRAGGRLLFTRAGAALMADRVAVAGLGAVRLARGGGAAGGLPDRRVLRVGAAVLLLALNVVALACHELGHALATKHAGRRVPAAGFLVYFGIPSVFVDTTDVWMAGRRRAAARHRRRPGRRPGAGRRRCSSSALAVPALAPWPSSSPSPGTSTRCST